MPSMAKSTAMAIDNHRPTGVTFYICWRGLLPTITYGS